MRLPATPPVISRLGARSLLLALPLVALAFAACSGGDSDDDTGARTPSGDSTPSATRTKASGGSDASDLRAHEDALRETAPAAVKAIFASGGVEAYSYVSQDFKDKCSLSDFLGVIALAKLFLGEIDEADIDIEITDIRYEDDRAYVTMTATLAGEQLDDDDDSGGLGDYWVYEDGAWKWGTDDEDPCSTDFSSDDDATPATGPGTSRGEPADPGAPVESGGVRVRVVNIDLDAADRLDEISDFPETPEAGMRVVLLSVRAEHAGGDGDETVRVSESNFKLTGSGNVLYDTFDHGCGFVDGGIDAEMFAGGSTEGLVCFTVPSNESNLILVFEPTFSFDGGERRYLALD